MTTLVAGAAAVVFALAAWIGTRAALRLCAHREPFADGPAPVSAPAWPFAAIGGAVGMLAALHGETALQLGALALVTVALAACAFADFRCGMVPDVFTLVPLAAILGAAALRRDPVPAIGAACLAVPLAGAALLSRARGMGWGDVKLAALGGALLGVRDAGLALIGACCAAYTWSMLRRRVTEPTAFAPYLVAAVAVALAVHPVP